MSFAEQHVKGIIDDHGTFSITLAPMPPSFQPYQLLVSSGGQSEVRDDILIGDVWLAAGQSNMVWELEDAVGGRAASVESQDPMLRLFEVGEAESLAPKTDVEGRWIRVRPRSARRFSAIGYFFGKDLREELDRPIGIIQVAYGGTRIEAWVSGEQLDAEVEFRSARSELEKTSAQNITDRRHWLDRMKNLTRVEEVDASDAWLLSLDPPDWPGHDIPKNTPTSLYNAMLQPVLQFPSRGMIWYQGESNRGDGRAYENKLNSFIAMLRAAKTTDYPIGIVQIAPYAQVEGFSDIQDAQRRVAQSHDDIGLVVTTDITELLDIHPRRKREVAERLANWALSSVYQRSDIRHSGPLARNITETKEGIEINFDFSDGLTTMLGSPISGFVLRDKSDRRIVPTATIFEDRVVLHWDQNFEPCIVEYHMRSDAFPTLTNLSGLPASPFRLFITEGCETRSRE
ncbi:MAG: sialate O-acetylesterase [Henriciella sp.]